MRFRIGKVPPDPNFDPEGGGWSKFREPSLLIFWLMAAPLSLGLAALTIVAIPSVGDSSAGITVRSPSCVAMLFLRVAGIFLSVLVAHEFVHLVAFPKFGLSRDSTFGIWLKAGVCYAYHGGEISRNRFLFVLSLPLVLLTIAPVASFWVTGKVSTWLGIFAVINALGASFDVLIFGLILFQVPSTVIIKNNGWDTYWRPKINA